MKDELPLNLSVCMWAEHHHLRSFQDLIILKLFDSANEKMID